MSTRSGHGAHSRTSRSHAEHEALRTSATGRSRVVPLDGLRAFALLIIMGYHFGVGALQGGFFSLDIFYVLSGYLITGLLLGEWARSARIALGAFWARRARRLLPALCVLLVVVTLVVRFAEPAGLYPDFRMSALSALFYFSNWWQIAASGNYFVATGAPSPLTHTWSLAVEEQFYLVWPLVVVGVLTLARRSGRGVEALLGISAAGVVASAATMALRYHPGANITRLYFGTDTHAQSILVGAVLACILTLVQRRRGADGMAPEARGPAARAVLFALGLVGLAGTLALTYAMTGTEAFDYRGGFLLSALSAAAIVTSVVTVPDSPLGRVLSLRPMVWMGTVSYGAYLWHYPVFIELDGARTGLHGPVLLVARFAATFALAAASWYLVERPVMEGRFWRSVQAVGPALVALGVTVAVVVVGTVATDVAAAPVRTAGLPATGGQALPAAERQALEADGAFGPHPVRFLLVGDSLALTMGLGLVQGSVADFGVRVMNKGVLGCDLDALPSVTSGTVDVPVSDCRRWPALWARDVATTQPEVAGVLVGRWAIADHLVGAGPGGTGGTRVSIDQPAWRRHLADQIRHEVDVLSAQGARVVLFTMPYIAPAEEAPDGSPWPENSPARVDAYNALLRQVARERPGTVTVLDLNRVLGPDGRYTRTVDGVTVRWADGIHISKAGGRWLEGAILPTVARLGLEVRAGQSG